MQIIKNIGKKYNLVNVHFEKMFRNIALGKISQMEFQGNIHISLNDYYSIMYYRSEFAKLFFDKDSHWLLWVCRCLYRENRSILSYLNEYISKICKITRGKLNTYKLYGWDVHILYVYQLVSYNFPRCIIPTAYSWSFDVSYIFKYFFDIYCSLSIDAKFILKIGSFLHDIGVTLSVKDHEKKGVPLTEYYYCELGIDDSLLNQYNISLNITEIIVALRAVVGNHQIINQVSSEASDKYIYEKINTAKKSFEFSRRLLELYNKDFVGIMSILAVSDMMAVDDSLLSMEKFEEIKEANSFLEHIITYNDYKRDFNVYGLKRIVSFLKDELKPIANEVILGLLQNECSSSKNVIDFIYNVKNMSYAMTAIKPLGDIVKTVRLIEVCLEIYNLSEIPLQELVIKFDPNINNERLEIILEQPADIIVAKEMLIFAIDNIKYTIEITC